jgi:Flp pilus assembly protein TadB
MPLDDAERSVLEETERSLAADDPSLDRRWRRAWDGRRRTRTHLAVALVAVLLMVGLCWLGLPGQALLVLLVAVGVLLGAGWRPRNWVPSSLRDT